MHHHTRKKRNHNKSKGGKKNNSVKIGGFLWNKQSTTGEFNNDTLNMFATVNKLLEIKKTNKNYLDRNNYDTIINIIDDSTLNKCRIHVKTIFVSYHFKILYLFVIR